MMKENKVARLSRRLALAVVLAVVILLAAVTCVRSVPTGTTGILTTFGKVEQGNLEAGIHIKAPWQNIVLMDNRVQKATVETEAFSADIQAVNVLLTVNYSINRSVASDLYERVGVNYYDTIIFPQLLENTKTVFGQYNAEGLIDHRDALAGQIVTRMNETVGEFGIDVTNISIEDLDFSDRFTDAIEAKQVATQELQRAQTEQQQATMTAKAAAEREQIAAEAKAAVERINADAEAYAITAKASAQAEANRAVAESLTDQLVEYTEIEAWNGVLPSTWVGGTDALPILNLDAGE